MFAMDTRKFKYDVYTKFPKYTQTFSDCIYNKKYLGTVFITNTNKERIPRLE
jgi:hypothetical protein